MLLIKRFSLLLSAVSLLVSCGGGGGGGSSTPQYTGLTTPAAITSTNVDTLGKSSAEASQKSVTQSASNDANPFAPIGINLAYQSTANGNHLIEEIATSLYDQLKSKGSLPAGVSISSAELGYPFCGGSLTAPDNFGSNGTLNGKITLKNLCYNDPANGAGKIILNGTIVFTETATELSMTYNMKITAGGETQSIYMSLVCQLDVDGFPTSCSITSDYIGEDGKTYRLADFTVSETSPGVFNFTARLYHPDHGYLEVTATNMSYACQTGYPSSGSITFTGAGGSEGTIEFLDCNSYQGTWNDGTSTGSFSGTW